jgi:hypothetical protein
MHGIGRVVFLERPAHQENIVRIIFGQQHWAKIRHDELDHIYILCRAVMQEASGLRWHERRTLGDRW